MEFTHLKHTRHLQTNLVCILALYFTGISHNAIVHMKNLNFENFRNSPEANIFS